MLDQTTKPETHYYAPDGTVINSRLPLLVYRGAVSATDGEDMEAAMKRTFASNNWTNNWTYRGVYPYPHYHSTCHECLGVIRGKMPLRLGGAAQDPMLFEVGDVIVIPAGISHAAFPDEDHRALGGTDDVLMVGGYYDGRDWDLLRDGEVSDTELRAAIKLIMSLPIPQQDPVSGNKMQAWLSAPTSLEWGIAHCKVTGIEDLHK